MLTIPRLRNERPDSEPCNWSAATFMRQEESPIRRTSIGAGFRAVCCWCWTTISSRPFGRGGLSRNRIDRRARAETASNPTVIGKSARLRIKKGIVRCDSILLELEIDKGSSFILPVEENSREDESV